MPVSVVFGAGKRHLAGDLVREVEKSLKDAGISVARFAHVTGKSLDITADSAVDEIKKNGSDFIVAIGGNTVCHGSRI